MRVSILFMLMFSMLFSAENPMVLQLTGVKTQHQYFDGTVKEVLIEREIPASCLNVGIEIQSIFSGDFAGKDVPKECQKSFVTVVGKAQPMTIEKGVQTVGEVEVLDFIKNKVGVLPLEYILVDSRKRDWFEQMSIPSAVNIPYDEIAYDDKSPEDFERMMKLLRIQKEGDNYNFSYAKTALFFCNGAWCAQSRVAIQKLLSMGYPKEKLLWYRGGLQDWLLFGFSVVKKAH